MNDLAKRLLPENRSTKDFYPHRYAQDRLRSQEITHGTMQPKYVSLPVAFVLIVRPGTDER